MWSRWHPRNSTVSPPQWHCEAVTKLDNRNSENPPEKQHFIIRINDSHMSQLCFSSFSKTFKQESYQTVSQRGNRPLQRYYYQFSRLWAEQQQSDSCSAFKVLSTVWLFVNGYKLINYQSLLLVQLFPPKKSDIFQFEQTWCQTQRSLKTEEQFIVVSS